MDDSALASRIDQLAAQLVRASDELREWQSAASSLSQQAALARSENQGAGRGLGGMLLGPKYRAAARRVAANSNADIARQLAQKRVTIAQEKARAQTQIRTLKSELFALRAEFKNRAKPARSVSKARLGAVASVSKELSLLTKLKEAYDLGLLTAAEFEQKKRQLLGLA